MKNQVSVLDIAPMTEDCLCGYIMLTNGVKVWFGVAHEIATQQEAQDIADIIIKALNND